MSRSGRSSVLAMLIAGAGAGAVAHADAGPPCPKRAPAAAATAAPLFVELQLDRLERLRADFSEEKHIALLARPIRSSGKLYFDRSRGMARLTRSPAVERVLLSPTTLRIEKGGHVEEVPLDRSKTLRAFALVFPALLRGERASLETTFDLELTGSPKAAWSLTLLPKDAAMCGLVARVVVSGHARDVDGLQVVETSGDTTETRLSALGRNDAIPAAEIDQAFGAAEAH